MICEEVPGAQCTILAPASWCWPSPANATDRVSPWRARPSGRRPGTSWDGAGGLVDQPAVRAYRPDAEPALGRAEHGLEDVRPGQDAGEGAERACRTATRRTPATPRAGNRRS